ncbi:MAG: pyrroline-5-carboxylate reductase [Bacteroidota bacterium]
MNILIIGGGNMGRTFARAFVNAHVVSRDHLYILERKKEERIRDLSRLDIAHIETDLSAVKQADLVILAVKPQDAPALFSQIEPFVDPGQVMLSVMAGITMEQIRQALGSPKIVRAMPNLPSQIGAGMTAFTATDEVSRLEIGTIQNLLATTGKTLYVEEEEKIDAVTAISGSGPAYVYFFMDALIRAARDMGFSEGDANLLVQQTFSGALSLFRQNSLSCEDWIQKVASKGGTTEAALKAFVETQLTEAISTGAQAALTRAQELGSQKD